MKPEDVGLREDAEFFKTKKSVQGNIRVTYATIHGCQNFSVRPFFENYNWRFKIKSSKNIFNEYNCELNFNRVFNLVYPFCSCAFSSSPQQL